jgi:hypothetical protein
MDKLTILVDSEWMEHPQVKELVEKGHQVMYTPPVDLILSKAAWNWSEHHWKYLDLALKEARKVNRLKPKEIKDGDLGPKDQHAPRRRRQTVSSDKPADSKPKRRRAKASKNTPAAATSEI